MAPTYAGARPGWSHRVLRGQSVTAGPQTGMTVREDPVETGRDMAVTLLAAVAIVVLAFALGLAVHPLFFLLLVLIVLLLIVR